MYHNSFPKDEQIYLFEYRGNKLLILTNKTINKMPNYYMPDPGQPKKPSIYKILLYGILGIFILLILKKIQDGV